MNLLCGFRYVGVLNGLLRHRYQHLALRQFRLYSRWRKETLPRGDGRDRSTGLNIPFEDHYKIRSHIELLIQDYAKKPIPPITYEYLTQYKSPLQNNEEYMLSIQTVNLLLCYTCRQLQAIQNLPYIVVLNPNIELANTLYLSTLETLLNVEYPYGLHHRDTMVNLLTNFLEEHQDTLTTLAVGFQEVMKFYDHDHVFRFLNLHLRNRISMKMLATHHLALLEQSDRFHHGIRSDDIGILHRDLKISSLVEQVGEFVNDLCSISYDLNVPVNIVEGHDVSFTCIPTSLEYVLTEVFKNSLRAHIERSNAENLLTQKPVEVTIVRNDNELQIRIRDFGGGIPPAVEEKMFDYSYSTVAEKKNDTGAEAYVLPGEHVNNVSGMGFGLPMCKAYMEMFGGRLDIQSLWGWGTDVYIKLTGPSKEMLQS